MSLRIRLIAWMALGLAASLGFGGALTYWNASRSVQTEMRAALAVGEQTVRNAVGGLPRRNSGDAGADLRHLISTFDGDRHLRAVLVGPGDAPVLPVTASTVAEPPFRVPAWFARLIGVTAASSARLRIPVQPDAPDMANVAVMLETDPQNEICEVWSDLVDSLAAMALFCGLTILVIHRSLGRGLRPLSSLSDGLSSIGAGDFQTRVAETGPPELARLAAGFNRMAAQLADMEAQNRRLHEQLLTLQEEERAELARDLHDEVGPFLFAVNVDAATIARLAADGRGEEISQHVASIRDAVAHMQHQVRAMLGRLRPIGLSDLGLAHAIETLAAFWHRRCPDIAFNIAVSRSLADDAPDEAVENVIYRIVQESMSNAVRHGRPKTIEVSVGRDGDRPNEVLVRIVDDGAGLGEHPGRLGFGLIGMRERVTAMGGSLQVVNRAGGGSEVVARLSTAAAVRSPDDAATMPAGP